jgi:hypothetical protein
MWIIDTNVRLIALTLLEQPIGETFQNVDIDIDFVNETPIAVEMIVRIDKWD